MKWDAQSWIRGALRNTFTGCGVCYWSEDLSDKGSLHLTTNV